MHYHPTGLTVKGPERPDGENVFLNNSPYKYKVYLFYYPGSILDEYIKNKVRDLADTIGKDLSLSIGKLYDMIKRNIKIQNFLVITITGTDSIASLTHVIHFGAPHRCTGNKNLWNPITSTIQHISRLYNLFVEEISDKLKQGRCVHRNTIVFSVKSKIISTFFRWNRKFLW